MNFLEEVKNTPRKVFTIRLKTPSERVVSLFSQYRLGCFGFCYEDPIQHKPFILVMNAFGLVLSSYSNIPLEIFLKLKILEEIHLYEVTDREAKNILEHFMNAEQNTPEMWLKRLSHRYWSFQYKHKNPFLLCMKVIEGKEVISTLTFKRKVEDDEVLNKDLDFLAQTWPFIYRLLLDNEFRFSLAIAKEDSLIHLLGNGIQEGKISYDALITNKYKEILPRLEENKAVIIEVQPCQSMEEICGQFQSFYHEIHSSVEDGKPVEIHLQQLRNCINQLFQANGLKSLPVLQERQNETAVVVFNKNEAEKLQLRNGKEIKIYDTKNFNIPEYEPFTPSVYEEILNYVDSIARPERPYEFVRASLVEKLGRK